MGVLTDFVVARREQAEQVLRSVNPAEEFDSLDAKGINPDTLAALYAILSGELHDQDFVGEPFLFEENPESRWVFEVPARLVSLLAAMGPKRLDDVASAWAALRWEIEFAFGWTVEEVRAVLAGLADLCREAQAKDQSVLMWVCL
jgi:hypothetical protein